MSPNNVNPHESTIHNASDEISFCPVAKQNVSYESEKAAIKEEYDEFACLQIVPLFATIIQKKFAIEHASHQSKEKKQHPHQSSSSVCNNEKLHVGSQSKLMNHIK